MPYPNEIELSVNVNWRKLTPKDIDSAFEVHKLSFPPIHGLVRPDERIQFESHINELGIIIGGFTSEQKLVAYGILDIYSPNKEHLCQHLNLSAKDSKTVAVLDGAATLPSYRGHHLHRFSIYERRLLAATMGYKKLIATVAPANTRSLRGLLNCGLRVIDYGKFYDGYDRLIVISSTDLDESKDNYNFVEYVDSSNVPQHQAALAKKLIGYDCVKTTILDSTGWYTKYGSKKN